MLLALTSPCIVFLTGGAWRSGVANSRLSSRLKAGERRFIAALEVLCFVSLFIGELKYVSRTELPTVSRLALEVLALRS